MGRKKFGTFLGLQGLTEFADDQITEDDLTERMSLLNDALAAMGCNCNGTAMGVALAETAIQAARNADPAITDEAVEELRSITVERCQRDQYFGGDISEIVMRSMPHIVNVQNAETGNMEPVTVRIKLETLHVEVDDNNEVMCWVYDEN